jgi:L-alanine-DL-glutamate epimerase-like enolase superfamily enzyme
MFDPGGTMRITAVEVHPVLVHASDPPFVWRRGLPGSLAEGYGAVLQIRTDAGCDGVAFQPRRASSTVLPDIVERGLREVLLGEDPLQREWLWHKVWEFDRVEEMPLYLLGLVDTALWDLAGRAAAMPTWQLLGGFRKEIPAYASTVTYASVEEYLDVADQCAELGYPALKLHAFGDAREDARLCEAVREHVGSDVPLMYDGSAGFDLPDAVYLGHALADAGYLWYEEPIREFSVTAYKWLSERVRVPLLVGETSDGAHMNTADFIASGCASYVRTSVELRGGFTGAMRTAHLADSYRLRAEPHGPTLTSRHLCMATSNCTYYESLVWGNPVRRERGIDERGMVPAPTNPGVGLPEGPEYPEALMPFVVAEAN